jgi:hypothetical protein
MDSDLRKDSYNKFEALPLFSYNCISYLIDHEEMLFKLLKYNDFDCWNKPNLTRAEKGALVYDGSPDETKFRVFMDVGADNSWLVEACILRISPLTITPTNYIYGNVSMGFEIYSHYKINQLSNYMTRIDYATQRIIEVMNGAEVEGLGRLYFDRRAMGGSKSIPIGAIPFRGRATIMCNWIA